VDEGQDMGENDWCLIEVCAEKRRRLWVFMDDTQAFLDRMGVPEDFERRCMKYRLGKPYRCPDGIQALADAYAGMIGSGGSGGVNEVDVAAAGFSSVKAAVEDKVIKVVGCEEGKVHDAVGSEISSLLGEGFKGSEIAVISLRGMDLTENIMHKDKIGAHQVVKATDERASERIVCDTFMRFKGLERPAVVVTDLRYVKDRLGTRMNIALTRALGVVRIVGEEAVLQQDPVLSPFVRGN
jgi:superfamily I DNA and RNA helicase